jgi:hypothetical protein
MQNCIAAKRHSNEVALRAEAQDVRRPLPKAARSKVAPVAQKTRSWTRSMNQGLTARFAEQNALPQPFAGRGMGAVSSRRFLAGGSCTLGETAKWFPHQLMNFMNTWSRRNAEILLKWKNYLSEH